MSATVTSVLVYFTREWGVTPKPTHMKTDKQQTQGSSKQLVQTITGTVYLPYGIQQDKKHAGTKRELMGLFDGSSRIFPS